MATAQDIRHDMQVLGSDGGMVGRVDGVEGDRIKLKRASEAGGGEHHFVPIGWVARVDDHVHLDRDAALIRDTWSAEQSTGAATARTRAATETPARGSKWIWVLGAVLLLLIIILGIRGFGYAASDPQYEKSAKGTLTDADRAASGVAEADVNEAGNTQ